MTPENQKLLAGGMTISLTDVKKFSAELKKKNM